MVNNLTSPALAPIVLFVYNRPWHTMQTIDALQKNELSVDSELFIYSDAAKNKDSEKNVNKVRGYIDRIHGFKKITIIKRKENWGLSNNIIDGVTKIVNKYGKVIVLEDDLVASTCFLKFMNDGLELYKNKDRVASIHGYIYPINSLPNTFFIRGADCWGWATWKDKWAVFEKNGQKLLNELKLKGLENKADFNNSYGFTQMLKDQIRGKNDSWAVRWYMSVFLKDMLALYPGKSHIQNIGNDNSGTHCGETDLFKVELGCNANIDNVNILEDVHSRIKIEYFFNSIKPTLVQKIKRVIFSRDLLKLLVPPFFLKALRRIDNNKFGWQGDYTTWQEAKNTSTGYNSDAIIQAVKSSLLKVKSGEAVYERDSVIFDEIQYSWPLLAGLMFVAAKSSGQNLKVLDFGGSLGSTYYQNKRFLDELCSVSWSVVEQRRFVTVGREEFANDRLSFYYTVGECVENEQPNILLLSSVLQYIENPYELLDEILKYEFEYILIDRVTFNNETDKDKITVQKIKLENYDSIPCWLFSERDFYKYFNCLYVLVEDFELANERVKNKYEKGMIWKKR